MKKPQTPIQIIADASKVPEYTPAAVKRLMAKFDLNEKAFALLMNITPHTVRLWTTGAAKPCTLMMFPKIRSLRLKVRNYWSFSWKC